MHRLRVYDPSVAPEDLVTMQEHTTEGVIYDNWFSSLEEARRYLQEHYPGHPFWLQGHDGLSGEVGWGHVDP